MVNSILRNIFIVVICCFANGFGDENQHISVSEEVLPKTPEPAPEINKVVIPRLRGIILLGEQTPTVDPIDKNLYKGIIIKGAKIPRSTKHIESKLKKYLGQEITNRTITEIKDTIYDFYKRNNRPLTIVEVPEQEVTTSILQLRIIESRLGKIRVEGNRWSNSARLKEYVSLRPNQKIDENRLIQSVSFMNRNPFRRVDIVYAPGEYPETTDVILAVKDRRQARFYVGTDNSGVKPIGEARWYAGLNWGNAFNLDHIFSYQFTNSYNINRFYAHTAEYLALLSWGHVLDIYGGYSKVHPRVSGPLKNNDGWSLQVSGRYTIPLKIYRYLEHEITFGGDFKRTNNTFEFTEDFPVIGNNVNITQLMSGYSGNYERNTFRLDFDGSIYWSPGQWIADQSKKDYGSLRPGAAADYFYFRGSFVYLQRLPHSFSFSLLTRGQIASAPLLPSEQFGLGGYDTVRGYEQREVNKDNALLLSAEVRTPAFPVIKRPKIIDALQFIAFYDYGWGIDIDTLPGGQKANYLMGMGPGLRYTIEPNFTARLDWGFKLHKKAEFGGGNSMFYFNVTFSY